MNVYQGGLQSVDAKAVAGANTKFCLDLFKEISKTKKGENIFVSPFSISVALAMTQLGAREVTAKCMAETLGWPVGGESVIHKQWGDYLSLLQQPNDNFNLSTANRIYVQKAFKILEEFLSKTKSSYKAEPVSADFANEAEKERGLINAWVAELTQNKIQDLIPSGVLNALTRMVLVNAIYFKGDWSIKFNEQLTKREPFKIAPGQKKDVQMMFAEQKYALSGNRDLKCCAIKIPYKNNDLSMVVILPDDDFGLQDLIKSLTQEKLTQILQNFGPAHSKVKLSLPKFEISSSHSLAEPLSALGMAPAFSVNDADFSGITGGRDLFVSAVLHKAYIKVNEEGTEAAAVTAVVMKTRCAMIPQEPKKFVVDHPFLYLIIDNRADNMVLFIGATEDPSKQ